MCALVYIKKRAAQKAADSGTNGRRRRDEAPTARRWCLGIITLAP
jgi:hypothetical protein